MLLVTHNGFDNHLQQLNQVLSHLKDNNMQVHVEETFLVSSSFDYLGYCLTHDGIKPQVKKIKGILNIAQPNNLRELHSFIGFVQYYRDMFCQRSDILYPLTSATSNTTKKFTSTTDMNTFFNDIK